MMRALAVLALVLSGLVLVPRPALASCVQRTTAELVAAADVIAQGSIDAFPSIFVYPREVTFRARDVLKGTLPSVVRVRIGPEIPSAGPLGTGATSVDYVPTPGEHVLYLRAKNGLETDSCSGSHRGGPTEDERSALGTGGPPAAATLADEFAALGVYPFVAAGLALAVIAAVLLARLRRRGGRKA